MRFNCLIRFWKKFLVLSFITFFFTASIISQAYDEDWENNDLDTEQDVQSYDSEEQKELLIIQSTGHLNLDPQLSSYTNEAQILNGLYEGLFSYDPLTLEPIPALASSYKVSRDKKTWTFTIRDNLRFSNGDPISAQSFYDSWLSLLDPKKNAPFASLLDCIEGVQNYRLGFGDKNKVGIQVKNEKNLIVKLIYPTDYLTKILCHHAFSVVHSNKAVQSGPFIIRQMGKTELVLTKNNYYWDKDAVALPSIRFIFSDDEDENTYLFNTGKVHWLSDYFNAPKLIQNNSLVFGTQFGTEYYFFKMKNGIWDNLQAREALLLALPWDELRENYYVPANTFLSRLYGYPEIYGIDETDIEEAQSILDSLNLSETEKQITIFIPDTEYHAAQVAIFKEAWEKIGVFTKIDTVPSVHYYNALSLSDADLFTYTWIGDFADPMAFLELFKKDSSLNESRWENNQFEKLLQEATNTSNSQKRYEKLSEAEQVLLDDYIVLPLSHPISVNIIDKDEIGGWYENALDLHPLKNLYFKKKIAIKNLLIANEKF